MGGLSMRLQRDDGRCRARGVERTAKFDREVLTPAQQAGLVAKRLTFQDIFMSFGPMARVAWIKNEAVRREWRVSACASNKT
jgi:hypothetical protein